MGQAQSGDAAPPPAVLVTGASRGLGRAIALAFARRGATVGIGYRANEDAARETEQAVADAGGAPVRLQADLLDPEAAKDIVQKFLEHTDKRIDVLVNNAGACRDAPTARMSVEDWDAVVGINLDAACRMIKAASRPMMRRRAGHIVNVASHAAVQGRAGAANYAAAKSGLLALTRSAARELGVSGVCVNAILPGVLESTGMGAAASPEFRETQRSLSVLGALGDADEVAAFVAHLTDMRRASGQVFALDSRILSWA